MSPPSDRLSFQSSSYNFYPNICSELQRHPIHLSNFERATILSDQQTSSPKTLQKKSQRMEPSQILSLNLARLEKCKLIPNSSKFRMMLCETFVSTGSCAFHNVNFNICGFVHDPRIGTVFRSLGADELLLLTRKTQPKHDTHCPISSQLSQYRQAIHSQHVIHWPNRQNPIPPTQVLANIEPFVEYHEAETVRATKKSLIKRCVFYFWDSFLKNLEIVQDLGKPPQTIKPYYSNLPQNEFHNRRFSHASHNDYYSRRLPIFIQNSSFDDHSQNITSLPPFGFSYNQPTH